MRATILRGRLSSSWTGDVSSSLYMESRSRFSATRVDSRVGICDGHHEKTRGARPRSCRLSTGRSRKSHSSASRVPSDQISKQNFKNFKRLAHPYRSPSCRNRLSVNLKVPRHDQIPRNAIAFVFTARDNIIFCHLPAGEIQGDNGGVVMLPRPSHCPGLEQGHRPLR